MTIPTEPSVAWLERALDQSRLELALEIYRYLAVHVEPGASFDVLGPASTHTPLLGALLARPELPMSPVALHNLVRVGQVVHELGPELTASLTLAHARALARVVDPVHRRDIAAAAVREGWSARDLASYVAASRVAASPDDRSPPREPARLLAVVPELPASNDDGVAQEDAVAELRRAVDDLAERFERVERVLR
ncbi:MAG: hypothetical protein KC635_07770 [Myxococcales bacterium]|nr:hypothetical protein [Myxococcales bacterium]MCB9735027.1 hypothetical protein [Deltaproteobacteria bacterium]